MAGSSQKLVAAGAAALVSALCAGGCRFLPELTLPGSSSSIRADVAAVLSRADPSILGPLRRTKDLPTIRRVTRALGQLGGDAAAAALCGSDGSLHAPPDVDAAFATAVAAAPSSARLLEAALYPRRPLTGPGDSPEREAATFAAAALGLGNCADADAERLLVRIAAEGPQVPEALEALFCHVRWRGRPLGPLPESLIPRAIDAYEKHASPRGRAGIGGLGRMSKDRRLLDPLVRLTKDADPEVRRAAALGLADGKDATARAPADADRAFAALVPLGDDPDERVAASACRAVASYDRPDAVLWLAERLKHPNFNVRVAAAEGLGTRKGAAALDALLRVAREDPSPSARYAAANAAAAIDAGRAQGLVESLLTSPEAYVRQAGVEVLGKSDAAAATERLAALAGSDPHVRVREASLDALKDRTGPAVEAAVRRALGGDDPVLASIAADVAATNGLLDLRPAVRALLDRFPGTPGADAREGAVGALSKFGDDSDWDRIRAAAQGDPDGGVRLAAQTALNERAGVAPPPPGADRRGVSAKELPGGAPLLTKDVLLVLDTSQGTMKIRLDAEQAPIHSSHVAHLARKGFYDGLTWHRVVPDFVIQGGCPRGDGSGNAGVTLPLEPTRIPFERGTLGMPRSNHPDTGGCQLFVCHSRAPHLDVKYTAFGRVVEGMEVIDRIDVGATIVRARVEEIR